MAAKKTLLPRARHFASVVGFCEVEFEGGSRTGLFSSDVARGLRSEDELIGFVCSCT